MTAVLVLRTCAPDLTGYGGFQWPESGPVEAPDWDRTPECGNGLHGLLWGEGDGAFFNWNPDARWLVCAVDADSVVEFDRKVKFPRCEVVHCGDRKSATEYIAANGGAGRAIVGGTATAGDRGTATAGDSGTATAGYSGTIAVLRWNGKRWKYKIAEVKDKDGEGELEPNTPYRLDLDTWNFVKAVQL